jgi:hypothetical protein
VSTRPVSAWWYAVPAVVGALSIIVAMLWAAPPIEWLAINTTNLVIGSQTFDSGQQVTVSLDGHSPRYVFATAADGRPVDSAAVFCRADVAPMNAVVPKIQRLVTGSSTWTLGQSTWSLVGRVTAESAGDVVISCRALPRASTGQQIGVDLPIRSVVDLSPDTTVRFAVTPSVDSVAIGDQVRLLARLLLTAWLGAAVAGVLGVVVWRTRRQYWRRLAVARRSGY